MFLFFSSNRTLLEEYCYACETLSGNKIEINKLNDKVKDIVQTLERRSVYMFSVSCEVIKILKPAYFLITVTLVICTSFAVSSFYDGNKLNNF